MEEKAAENVQGKRSRSAGRGVIEHLVQVVDLRFLTDEGEGRQWRFGLRWTQ